MTAVIPVPQVTSDKTALHDRQINDAMLTIAQRLNTRFRGEFRISDPATSHTVLFRTSGFPDQEDANYFILVRPKRTSLAPAVNSFIIKKVNRATDGFTVTIAVAPGSGHWIDFNWWILEGNPVTGSGCEAPVGSPGDDFGSRPPIRVPYRESSSQRSYSREMRTAIEQIKSGLDSEYQGVHRQSDATQSVFVNFEVIGLPDQIDANFDVFITPIGVGIGGGYPPSDAFVVWYSRGTELGVSWRTEAAPGSGSWIDWEWKIFRWV